MKWIKASENKSTHYQKVCCRRLDYEDYYFTAYWDFSKKCYISVNDNSTLILPEDIEWLDETESPFPQWVSVDERLPEHNLGVLVFIPGEDDHITSGMWDIENKWLLLDEYRVPECEVTHWMLLPSIPKTNNP